jgi:hypothetical protein
MENRDVQEPIFWSMGPDYLRFEALVRGSNDLKLVGTCVLRKKSVVLFLQRGVGNLKDLRLKEYQGVSNALPVA